MIMYSELENVSKDPVKDVLEFAWKDEGRSRKPSE
jgi:hypothetical protein